MIRLWYRSGGRGPLVDGVVARRSGEHWWVMESGQSVHLDDVDDGDLEHALRLPIERTATVVRIRERHAG